MNTGLAIPIYAIFTNRYLFLSLVKQEIVGRYKGSVFGLLWSFINPLFLLGLYTFFFKYILSAKWQLETGMYADFALMLFSGLIVHTFMGEVLQKSTSLVVNNANYVKKVIFPLDLFVISSVVSAVAHMAIGLLVLVAMSWFVQGSLSFYILLLPVVLLPLMVLCAGLAFFLSSLGVFLRDVEQLMGSFVVFLMFTSTIFFPISVAPEFIRPFIMFNPLTVIVESVRDLVVLAQLPNWQWLGTYMLVALVVYIMGVMFFNKTRKGFADVL